MILYRLESSKAQVPNHGGPNQIDNLSLQTIGPPCTDLSPKDTRIIYLLNHNIFQVSKAMETYHNLCDLL